MGSVLVFPHKSDDDGRYYNRMALGPMTNVRPSGGKVRVGYVDVLGGPVRHRMVSVAPVFDPLAISMGPWSVGTTDCPGCGWKGYSHDHDIANDGPRGACCDHNHPALAA